MRRTWHQWRLPTVVVLVAALTLGGVSGALDWGVVGYYAVMLLLMSIFAGWVLWIDFHSSDDS